MQQPAADATTVNFPLVVYALSLMSWILHSQFRVVLSLLRRSPQPESPPSPRSRWTGLSVLAVLLSYIAIQKLVFDLVSTQGPAEPDPRVIMLTVTLSNLLFIMVGPSVLRRTSRVAREEFDLLGPEPGKSFLDGVSTWPKLAPWIYGAFLVALRIWPASKHPVEQMLRSDQSGLTILLASLSAVVMAPLGEEFLFRGVLLPWLTRRMTPGSEPSPSEVTPIETLTDPTEESKETLVPSPAMTSGRNNVIGFWSANITTSIIFGMLHGAVWPSPIPIFLLSLGLGYLYHRAGGIAAPIGLHMTFNGISTLFLNLSLLSGNPATPEPKPTITMISHLQIMRDR